MFGIASKDCTVCGIKTDSNAAVKRVRRSQNKRMLFCFVDFQNELLNEVETFLNMSMYLCMKCCMLFPPHYVKWDITINCSFNSVVSQILYLTNYEKVV